MKRLIYLFILLISLVFFTGCKKSNTNPLLYKEKQKESIAIGDGEDINFLIEKMTLSKSYQNLNPKVDIVKKELSHKLLICFGLVESSGIRIERIDKNGDEINIYASNKNRHRTNQLVVPHALIELDESDINSLDSFTFNIIPLDYTNIDLKFDANEARNIVNSAHQISANNYPNISLLENKEGYYWTLDYSNVFDRSFKDNPVINLSVDVDASSGEILSTEKESMSSFIDNGHVLDFASDKYILYKKANGSSDKEAEDSLWIYDLKSQERKNIYNSDSKIISASFDPSHKQIALLESGEKSNRLYLIPVNDFKAYRLNYEGNFNPYILRWLNSKNLYIISRDEKSTYVSNYKTEEDKLELMLTTEKSILDIDIYEDYFLVSEKSNDDEEKSICLSKDLKEQIYNDSGYHGKFLKNGQLAYISTDSKNDNNKLNIYDIKENKLVKSIKLNVTNYSLIYKNILAIVEKNPNNNDFTLHEYDLDNNQTNYMISLTSDNISLSNYDNILYVNSSLPFDELETQIIYSMDLSSED